MSELARARLFDLNRQRDRLIAAVEDRVISSYVEAAWESRRHGLEYVLNEAAYFEMTRLEKSPKKRHKQQHDYWHDVAVRVGRNTEEENAAILAELVRRYAQDVVGSFNPWVYRLTSRAIPFGLNAFFNVQRLGGVLKEVHTLADKILVSGEVERWKRLSQRGTLVVVPTHSSNMDSILVGWALEHLGLPPVTYGAGKNLFRAPLTAFFMRNLGAYKVDRRLRHSLYNRVLKTVSQLFIEWGFHSLFFPGGTRSRSGAVEQHLKLGLAGTALSAYIDRLKQNRPRRVYIAPLTINYHLVLEAETLISDHLRADGRHRYIIEDDEFSDLGKVLRFANKTMGMDNPLCLNFCPPMDCFGNRVDDDGESLDRQGRHVDPSKYVETDDGPEHESARDREYTRLLGTRIAESFRCNTVLFSTHIVALALFELLGHRHRHWDLYSIIRFGRGELVSYSELARWCDRLLEMARHDATAGRVVLGAVVSDASTSRIIDEACRYFTMYHATPLIERRGDSFEVGPPAALYFYSNRARGYGWSRRLPRSS